MTFRSTGSAARPARSASGMRALLLAACVLLGVASAIPASAQGVDAIVVKVSDAALPAGATALPADLDQALRTAFGVPFTQAGRTRDGAFTLRLAVPLESDAARAAINQARLEPALLYANAAPGAPVPATAGRPTDRIIVKYRDPVLTSMSRAGEPLDAARVTRLAAEAGLPVAWLRGAHDGANVLQLLHRLPIGEVEAIAARIAQDADVDYAQPDYIRTKQVVPTDPCYASASVAACSGGYQWDLFDPVGGINMPAAWNITTGSADIRIAVLDTGILFNHPDLDGRIVGGYDTIADCAVANDGQPGPCTWSSEVPNMQSRDSDAADPGDWITAGESAGGLGSPPYDWFDGCFVDSSSWHGSHVAGTIGAIPSNGIGIAGINWVSKIVPMRVLGKCGGYTSDIAAAMVWSSGGTVAGLPVNASPARVLNLSLGGGGTCDPASQSAINSALSRGAVVVVAAGNENQNASIHSPASCNGVITVAATTKDGRRARYSNYGSKVEIAAPGGNADGVDPDILSSINSGATSPNPSGYVFARYAGTSMATPHVAGVASLMLSVNPALTPAQVLSKLQTTARIFPTPGPACSAIPQPSACNCTTTLCGAGIMDAAAAVASAVAAGTTIASSANPSSTGAPVTFTATVTGNAPTGTVKFEDGATTLTGCGAVALSGAGDMRTAACVAGALTAGSHTIRASYSGDGGNSASSAMLTQTVVTASTTTVASSSAAAFIGASITFTATVAGAAPTGTVRFSNGATTITGCGAVALTGAGNSRTAACAAGVLAQGTYTINVAYNGDAGNAASSGQLTQVIAPPVPGTATIVANPYGALTVQGATLVGNTISNMSNNVVIQLGNVPGTPATAATIEFQGLNLAPGSSLWIRSGAAGQFVYLVDKSVNPSVIGGYITANDFSGGAGFPVLYLKNANGITINAGAAVNGQAGIGIDTLGATWTVGQPLVNNGVIDAGVNLEMFASRITGGGVLGNGEFRGNNITIHTFGNANNPINGNFFLQNGLLLQASSGVTNHVALTLNAYGSTPQVLNFRVVRGNNVTVRMPSAWPPGSTYPVNNAVVAPAGTRPAGVPDPGYGGGSMIIQAEGALALDGGGTGDFVFPGGIVLKSDVSIDLAGVLVNQGWTTSGKSFQGVFLEAPNIFSSNGNIRVYGNDLNWINFSTLPNTPVRSFTLARNPDNSASFTPSDATAPHLNTYSTLSNTAASGGCWTCLVNTAPVNMFGP